MHAKRLAVDEARDRPILNRPIIAAKRPSRWIKFVAVFSTIVAFCPVTLQAAEIGKATTATSLVIGG